ncbi:histidine kinase [Halarcobacter mediterraneus]|uniref:histidine kinase n=1 Tax=Halarcobacter mediterraneus TaxID=2023153 RepID=A0A4Q1AS51_9BACT|nr:7TM diverse intracellular signaling domain-containing protein [Halarcobacter mediterraneus]RXK12513.1 histidine kinase [Halarcobacter mediterraneus]
MHIKLLILVLLLFNPLFSKTLPIYSEIEKIDLLRFSQIYIDSTQNLSILDIKKENINFRNNDKKMVGFGYSPAFNVWIKFTLKNETEKKILKILEYDNPLTTHIEFYSPDNNYRKIQKGLFFKDKNTNTINSTFQIVLEPFSKKTYYIKAKSEITPLIVKINLWENSNFLSKELKHQAILCLFFGAMLILAIYNLFIYFFTKDVSYLYYVLYIIGIIIHHSLYVGLATTYILESYLIKNVFIFASVIVAIPILALAFFTKEFLHTKQYPKNNRFLNIYILILILSIIFFLLTNSYDKYRNILTMLLLVYLMSLTIYAALKKNTQAYFILFGWSIFLLSGLAMFLSSAGVFNIYQYFPYFVETSFVLEAIIFSIALANKINKLQKQKNEANQRLLKHQESETKRLSKEVNKRTKDLKETLVEKELLLKELNHRVKNNMQTIVSLIRLQNDEVKNEKLNDILLTIQNRINAMSHLHELLYKQDNISHINTYAYFEVLIEEVKESYKKDVDIKIDIKTNLRMEQAIYCGLILNELLTNSFKYAFPNLIGKISITLTKKNNLITLIVKDNGIGYNKEKVHDSLGLTLVDTLARKQLKGNIFIDTTKGVFSKIIWEDKE